MADFSGASANTGYVAAKFEGRAGIPGEILLLAARAPFPQGEASESSIAPSESSGEDVASAKASRQTTSRQTWASFHHVLRRLLAASPGLESPTLSPRLNKPGRLDVFSFGGGMVGTSLLP